MIPVPVINIIVITGNSLFQQNNDFFSIFFFSIGLPGGVLGQTVKLENDNGISIGKTIEVFSVILQ